MGYPLPRPAAVCRLQEFAGWAVRHFMGWTSGRLFPRTVRPLEVTGRTSIVATGRLHGRAR